MAIFYCHSDCIPACGMMYRLQLSLYVRIYNFCNIDSFYANTYRSKIGDRPGFTLELASKGPIF